MKTKVICKKCGASMDWRWGNFVAKCDGCNELLQIKDVRLDKESRQIVMPFS
jgi:hypothetical protein